MNLRPSLSGFFLCGLLALLFCSGCRKEEQAVRHVAANATSAERRSVAASSLLDQERAQLGQIPLPTKSRYIDVHEPGGWQNPFLSVDTKMIDLRITLADANPSSLGAGGMLRPAAARRQEIQINPRNMAQALIALPAAAWPYGRVVAVEEYPLADRKSRPAIRRQIEALIRQLNDLGVVVDEWPAR